VSSYLERIFAAKRIEVAELVRHAPLAEVRMRAAASLPPRPFIEALRQRRPAIIAEIKRASPSKGDIQPGLNPASVARAYAAAGAAAISVLTDVHFKGSLADLRAVRAAVDVPLLRKDFIFDPYQIYEARAEGADCVLLILAMLAQAQAGELLALAAELGLAVLVEVHNRGELDQAERIGAALIGINNRDLHTFVTSLAVTEALAASYHGSALLVSESGIEGPDDLRRLDRAGARAFLIGESLLRAGEPAARLALMASALEGQG
jgi:indole-3-glycerol phosphate synthase